MQRFVRIEVTQEDNPRGPWVNVMKSADGGKSWEVSIGWRIGKAIVASHPWNPEDVPNEYIHMDVIRRIVEFVRDGYRFIA